MEDLDPDYDPDVSEFDGPDELMQLDEMELEIKDSESKDQTGTNFSKILKNTLYSDFLN